MARTVATLAEESLVRERPDLLREGTVGRPSIPLQIHPDRHWALGVHVGKCTTTVALVDLTGRLVAQRRMATAGPGVGDLVDRVVQRWRRIAATTTLPPVELSFTRFERAALVTGRRYVRA